ncbi:cholesterol transport system auxiliary component [Nitrosomonas eutropha]|uniref:Cholesterol transport system auxiliary component n=1 Tax=Nitrosomonas eutropha TaxID=916 RepID=A0A1I7H5L2_9PROT|nr:ABC-type transport auxiliary lipoprotein family protein [Nitrosomonas eutropha]SFU55970.1 cholesterol transport system auxiliary component [Nitrosomonas eutropha]
MMVKISVVLLAVLLTGCTLTPKVRSSISVYDLGPSSAIAPGASLSSQATIQIANITAPVWLDTQSIHYRLAYHDPARIYTYADSRWNAPPAELLTERLRQYFATGNIDRHHKDDTPVNYLLKIDLGEFTQIFNTPGNSQVIVQLRASLYEPTSRLPIAHQSFLGRQETQTADAAGSVTAFIQVSDNLLNELVQWLSDIRQ